MLAAPKWYLHLQVAGQCSPNIQGMAQGQRCAAHQRLSQMHRLMLAMPK